MPKTYPSYLRLVQPGEETNPDQSVPLHRLSGFETKMVAEDERQSKECRWWVILFRSFLPDRFKLEISHGGAHVWDRWDDADVFSGYGVQAQENAHQYWLRRNQCWRADLRFIF